jgi:hypothetical protein
MMDNWLRTFSAGIKSSALRMYAHVNVTDAPASSVSKRKFMLMASSSSRLLAALKFVHAMFVHATSASWLSKPKWVTRQFG